MTASSSSVRDPRPFTPPSFATLSEPTFRPSWSSGTLIRAAGAVLPTDGLGHELLAVENAHRRARRRGQLLRALGDQLRHGLELELGGGDLRLGLHHPRAAARSGRAGQLGELARGDVLDHRERGPRRSGASWLAVTKLSTQTARPPLWISRVSSRYESISPAMRRRKCATLSGLSSGCV